MLLVEQANGAACLGSQAFMLLVEQVRPPWAICGTSSIVGLVCDVRGIWDICLENQAWVKLVEEARPLGQLVRQATVL